MYETHMELFQKLSRLQWLLQRQHFQRHAEHGPLADTTRGQGRVLAMLKLQPEISIKDLSYLLGIRQQSLSELLNKLEKGEYISRTPSETDKRVMMIALTEKGKMEQTGPKEKTDIFCCLNDEEQATLSEYLDRIIAMLEEELGAYEDENEMFQWAANARERMGDEWFERMKAMKKSGFFSHRGFPPHGEWGGCPEGFPGAERFDSDYDGPMPFGRGGNPFGGRGKKNHADKKDIDKTKE